MTWQLIGKNEFDSKYSVFNLVTLEFTILKDFNNDLV